MTAPDFRTFYRKRNFHSVGSYPHGMPYDAVILEMMETVADWMDVLAAARGRPGNEPGAPS